MDVAIAPIPEEIMGFKVKGCMDVNDGWNVTIFQKYVPKEIWLKICAKHPPTSDAGVDTLSWANGV